MPLSKTEEQQRQAAISLLKRLPPQDLEDNLDAFEQIAPHLKTSLPPFVGKPSTLMLDEEVNRHFIACEYNCDKAHYRSPWSNKYFPPMNASAECILYKPMPRIRKLEEMFNEVFAEYKTTYYEGGVSSVYMWDMDEGFAAAFLVRKELSQTRGVEKGLWDISHIVEVREHTNIKYTDYKLVTSLYLRLDCSGKALGKIEMGELLSRRLEERHKKQNDEAHLGYIGRMIEETEISLRRTLDDLYAAKHRDTLGHVRVLDEDLQPDGERWSRPSEVRKPRRVQRAKSAQKLLGAPSTSSSRADSAPPVR